MAEDPHRPKKKRLTSNIITVIVGTNESGGPETFHVHEDVLKEKSDFFRAAIDRKWKEGQSRHIELPEDDPEGVSIYLDWLYGKAIPRVSKSLLSTREFHDQYTMFCKLYVLGEKIQDTKFRNEVLHNIGESCDEKYKDGMTSSPDDAHIMILYEGTPTGSPARRLIVALHVERGNAIWLERDVEEYHPEFLLDLARAFMAKGGPTDEAAEQHLAVETVKCLLSEIIEDT